MSSRHATILLVTLVISALLGACSTGRHAPVAERRPVTTTLHGDTRIDEYAWLRDREDPGTLAYLHAENAYAEAQMAHTRALQESLYGEMIGRFRQTDQSVPSQYGAYMYFHRTEEGRPYPTYCRFPVDESTVEEVILDMNAMAEDHVFFDITTFDISPDNRHLAYALDTSGYEEVSIHIKDLQTGRMLSGDTIADAGPWNLAWASDGRTLFYTRTDASKRPDRVFRHVLGTDPATDALVAREDDVRFDIDVERTRSNRYMLINSLSSTTSETRFVRALVPNEALRTVVPRRSGVRYTVDHLDIDTPGEGMFYILTDDGAPNFKLVTAPVSRSAPGNWKTIVDHSEAVFLQGIDVFRDHVVLSERRDGYTAISVLDHGDHVGHPVSLPGRAGTVSIGTNKEYDSRTLRYTFSSLVTPERVLDLDLDTGAVVLRKEDEVLGGYDPSAWETDRLYATARDGRRVPISIVHRRGLVRDGTHPCVLYAYGSYGASTDPTFSSVVLSLLDRGYVYAIAHVRGGLEMGRSWKEEGKMFHKKNTFTDFIACAEFLQEQGYTSPDRLAVRGGSAGGLLIGAVLNMRPDLFAAAHAAVPFVDVINTMLDASIPLTTGEYEEWGNPAEESSYHYIRGYSPYDNVAAQAYPHLLVTAGLHDSRVHYWEPAKWTARLRYMKTSPSMLLLRTNMGAGHGGASGRYDRYRERAFEYAFIIDRVRDASARACDGTGPSSGSGAERSP